MKWGSTVLTVTMFAFSSLFACYLIPYLISINPQEWAVPLQHTLHCLVITTFKHAEMLPVHYRTCLHLTNCLDNLSGEHLNTIFTCWLKKKPKHLYLVSHLNNISRSGSVEQHSSTLWMPGEDSQEYWAEMPVGVFCSNLYCVLTLLKVLIRSDHGKCFNLHLELCLVLLQAPAINRCWIIYLYDLALYK